MDKLESLLNGEDKDDSVQRHEDLFTHLMITPAAFRKIQSYAYYTVKEAGRSMECYGFLLNLKDRPDCIVRDAYFAEDQEVSGVSVEIPGSAVIAAGDYAEQHGYRVVGWWHSHGLGSTFHSPTDAGNFEQVWSAISSNNQLHIPRGAKTIVSPRLKFDSRANRIHITGGFDPRKKQQPHSGEDNTAISAVLRALQCAEIEYQTYATIAWAYSMVVSAGNCNPYLKVLYKEWVPQIAGWINAVNKELRFALIQDTVADITLDASAIRREVRERLKFNGVPIQKCTGWRSMRKEYDPLLCADIDLAKLFGTDAAERESFDVRQLMGSESIDDICESDSPLAQDIDKLALILSDTDTASELPLIRQAKNRARQPLAKFIRKVKRLLSDGETKEAIRRVSHYLADRKLSVNQVIDTAREREFGNLLSECSRMLEQIQVAPIYAVAGELNLSLKRYDSAVAAFEKAREINSKSYLALRGLGKTLDELKQDELASKIYLETARVVLSGGKMRTAIKYCSLAAKLLPNNCATLSELIQTQQEVGDFEGAYRSIQRLLVLQPAPAVETLALKAEIEEVLEKYLSAIESYGEAIKLNPNVAAWWISRARIQDSIINRIDPKSVLDAYHKGIDIAVQAQDFPRVIAYSKTALHLHNNESSFWIIRAEAERAIKDNESAAGSYLNAVLCLQRTNRHDAAKKYCSAALDLAQNDSLRKAILLAQEACDQTLAKGA